MSVLRDAGRLLLVAVRFLTRLPVPSGVPGSAGDVGPPGEPSSAAPTDELRRAAGAFPAVGIVVAGVGIGVRVVAGLLWDPVVATVLAVAAMVTVTGALHEDGLADSADGLWGGWTPAQRLEIMRDSRLGTYGVAVLVGSLALRVALLADVPLGIFARAVLVGHVLGRASTLAAVRFAPALPGSSAEALAPGPPMGGALVAAATVLAVTGAALGVGAVPALALALGLTWAGARVCRSRVGGVGGDTLGAVNQVVHLCALGLVVALHGQGWLSG